LKWVLLFRNFLPNCGTTKALRIHLHGLTKLATNGIKFY
jgi:hypothetical protein